MADRLHIENVQITLGDSDRKFHLHVSDFDIFSGQTVALTGGNGTGKTLLLEMIGLLRRPDPGAGYFLDTSAGQHDLGALWMGGAGNKNLSTTRGQVFGFVPQSGGLLPFLTCRENIILPQQLCDRVDPDWCDALITRLELGKVEHLFPDALSLGQRQRAAVARALSHRPNFVIADEPTAALDPETADAAMQLLLDVAREQGAGVILSSHDLGRLARFEIPQWTLQTYVDAQENVHSVLEKAP